MSKGNPLVTEELIASSKQGLGELFLDIGQVDSAEVYLEEAASIVRRIYEADNPGRAEIILPLGRLRLVQQRYEEAQLIILECLFAMEKKFGTENPLLLDALEDLLALQRASGKDADAVQTAERIRKMCERWQIVTTA